MKIRDRHAVVNGDFSIIDIPSDGLQIVADDGNTLFELRIDDNVMKISSGHVCRHNGRCLDDSFSIRPNASNLFSVVKHMYVEEGG